MACLWLAPLSGEASQIDGSVGAWLRSGKEGLDCCDRLVWASDLRREAFFRAGHVVGARYEGFRVRSVCLTADAISWIDVDGPVLPRKGPLVRSQDREAARSLIRALLAGTPHGSVILLERVAEICFRAASCSPSNADGVH